jgi:hypothetical protein
MRYVLLLTLLTGCSVAYAQDIQAKLRRSFVCYEQKEVWPNRWISRQVDCNSVPQTTESNLPKVEWEAGWTR